MWNFARLHSFCGHATSPLGSSGSQVIAWLSVVLLAVPVMSGRAGAGEPAPQDQRIRELAEKILSAPEYQGFERISPEGGYPEESMVGPGMPVTSGGGEGRPRTRLRSRMPGEGSGGDRTGAGGQAPGGRNIQGQPGGDVRGQAERGNGGSRSNGNAGDSNNTGPAGNNGAREDLNGGRNGNGEPTGDGNNPLGSGDDRRLPEIPLEDPQFPENAGGRDNGNDARQEFGPDGLPRNPANGNNPAGRRGEDGDPGGLNNGGRNANGPGNGEFPGNGPRGGNDPAGNGIRGGNNVPGGGNRPGGNDNDNANRGQFGNRLGNDPRGNNPDGNGADRNGAGGDRARGQNGLGDGGGMNENPRNRERLPAVEPNRDALRNRASRSTPVERTEETRTRSSADRPSSAASGFAGFFTGLIYFLAYLMIGVVCGFIIYLVIKTLMEFRWPEKAAREVATSTPKSAAEPEHPPGAQPPDMYVATARKLASEGQYREAVAQLLLGAMSSSERAGWVRFQRGLTMRNYLQALHGRAAEYQAFRNMVKVFEPLRFGRRDPLPEHFEQSLRDYEAGFSRQASVSP